MSEYAEVLYDQLCDIRLACDAAADCDNLDPAQLLGPDCVFNGDLVDECLDAVGQRLATPACGPDKPFDELPSECDYVIVCGLGDVEGPRQ